LAILVRMAAELYLVGIVVRDMLMPEYDVVRAADWRDLNAWWSPSGGTRLT
jgi:hypothetical protein